MSAIFGDSDSDDSSDDDDNDAEILKEEEEGEGEGEKQQDKDHDEDATDTNNQNNKNDMINTADDTNDAKTSKNTNNENTNNNDDNKNEETDGVNPNSSKQTEEEKEKNNDDDDGIVDSDSNNNNDESDVEFDDDNAIVGRTKNKAERKRDKEMEKMKRRREQDRFNRYSEDDDPNGRGSMENGDQFQNEGGRERKEEEDEDEEEEPLGPPRTLSVLDIPPPITTASFGETLPEEEEAEAAAEGGGGENKKKRPKPQTMHMTKLPNFVNINTEAYDKDTYDPEDEEKQYNGYIHNMIRWRYKRDPTTGDYLRDKDDGKLQRESNTRVVKWSDGSLTLHIGMEAFEVDSFSSMKDKFPGMNGYLYLSQKAFSTGDGDDENSKKNLGTVLECMGPITSKLIPKPSLRSEAHKNLTLTVRQRNMKKSRIAEYITQVDPEKVNSERIKNKDDLHRSRGGQGAAARRSTGSSNRMHRRRPGRKFYREDDAGHYDSVSIRRMKNDALDDDVDDYGNVGEESDSDDGWTSSKRYKKKKLYADDEGAGLSDDDDDDDVNMDDADSESDEDLNVNMKRKSRANIIDDDDE